MKALVGAFNQEEALVGAFSVITNLRMELFQALEDKEDMVDSVDTAIRQLPVGLDSGMLRDYAYNFLNFMLNYVGILVHAVILQLFIQP